MRPEESAYWDHVAVHVKGKGRGELNDNIWKRCEIVGRVLAHRPVHARILEIGAGQGLGAAVVNLCTNGRMQYTGTDVSAEFCKFVALRWKLNVAQTDILNLPDGPFDMIWAFDTLEHVRPEDRPAGYREMGRVLGPHGLVLLNVPMDESGHPDEFDWGMKEREVFDIAEATNTRVVKFEPYHIEEVGLSYLWAELLR